MQENIKDVKFKQATLFGQPVLFAKDRIDRANIPAPLYCYDIRSPDDNPAGYATVEHRVRINRAGTVVTAAPIDLTDAGYLSIDNDLKVFRKSRTLEDYCRECGISFEPQDSLSMDDVSY